MKYTNLLEEALDAWEDARMGVIDELANIPSKHFEFRASPDVRSIRELAIHILEVSEMMVGELSREDTDFHRAAWPELLNIYAKDVYRLQKQREILAFLKTSLKRGIDSFRKAGELHMLQNITRFDGKKGTRLAWLHHGIAQEMYHRGQITTYARLLGVKPALTKLIEAG